MCTDAYRAALTRDLSPTASSAPTSTPAPSQRHAAAAGREGVVGRPLRRRTNPGQDMNWIATGRSRRRCGPPTMPSTTTAASDPFSYSSRAASHDGHRERGPRSLCPEQDRAARSGRMALFTWASRGQAGYQGQQCVQQERRSRLGAARDGHRPDEVECPLQLLLAGDARDQHEPEGNQRQGGGSGADVKRGGGGDPRVEEPDGQPLRAEYPAGCDGGRSLIRRAAGIEFPGWDPSTSSLIAEVEMGEEPGAPSPSTGRITGCTVPPGFPGSPI